MHGATYDRKGECTAYGRSLTPLRTHPLRIESDGSVFVRTDRVTPRESFEFSQLVAPPEMLRARADA
jgi:hypothetical protein